jgi:GST-like protein
MVNSDYVVHGAAGSGSVPIEAALTLAGQAFRLVEAAPWGGPGEAAQVARVNPMRQVPALELPTGELMTESAAILLHLAEQFPQARLGPQAGEPGRAAFLRWMVYVPAAIYSLYWVRDDPARLAADDAAQAVILERTADRIAQCWAAMDAQISPGRYLLGDELSVLDLYVTVLSRWRPRRRAFYDAAPKMAGIVRRVDADPRLAAFWAERMPFEAGWEG